MGEPMMPSPIQAILGVVVIFSAFRVVRVRGSGAGGCAEASSPGPACSPRWRAATYRGSQPKLSRLPAADGLYSSPVQPV